MSVILTFNESQVLTALRGFLLSILPSGTEVIKGQENEVSEPDVDNFVVMTPILKTRIATNVDTYQDGILQNLSQKNAEQSTSFTVQLDVHGSLASDNTQIITTLFRDEYCVEVFATYGIDIAPLYTSDPHQIPFENDSQQIETRWVIDAVMQINPIVLTPQQSMLAVDVALAPIDQTFKP